MFQQGGIFFSIRSLSIAIGLYFIFVFLLEFLVFQQGGILFSFSIRLLSIPTGRYFIFVFLFDFLVYQQDGILYCFFY